MEAYTQEIILGLVIVVVILAALVLRLELRLRNMLRGNRTETVEASLSQIEGDIESFKSFKKELKIYLENAEKRLKQSIQGTGTIRFNPFKGEGLGGKQSFATGFLSENGDGVVLSSLYSRDRVSIFAKPLKDFKSEYELTGEEQDAIKLAKEKLQV